MKIFVFYALGVKVFPHERSFQQMVEQSADVHVLQSVEEIVEVRRVFPQECFQQCAVEDISDLRVLQAPKQIVAVGEQNVDNHVPQGVEQFMEDMLVSVFNNLQCPSIPTLRS